VLRGPGHLEDVPPTPVSAHDSWEHIGPMKLFASVASIAQFFGSPLAYSIFGRNVTFLRHVHPLTHDKDSFMNDDPLGIHTDFVCFPMIPQFAIYAMLRPDSEGSPDSAGFFVSPLDSALSHLRTSLGEERFQTVLDELMEPHWDVTSCKRATWRSHVGFDKSSVVRSGPRPVVFRFPTGSQAQEREGRAGMLPSELEQGQNGTRPVGWAHGETLRSGRCSLEAASDSCRRSERLHFVLGLEVVNVKLRSTNSQDSYDLLRQALNDSRVGMHMRAGDIVVVDNTRAAHGREPFESPKRLDGSDRWLYRAFANDRERFYSYLEEMVDVPARSFMRGDGSIEVDQAAFVDLVRQRRSLRRPPVPPSFGGGATRAKGPKKSEREAKRSRRQQKRSREQQRKNGAWGNHAASPSSRPGRPKETEGRRKKAVGTMETELFTDALEPVPGVCSRQTVGGDCLAALEI